jgi:hypothetical protein
MGASAEMMPAFTQQKGLRKKRSDNLPSRPGYVGVSHIEGITRGSVRARTENGPRRVGLDTTFHVILQSKHQSMTAGMTAGMPAGMTARMPARMPARMTARIINLTPGSECNPSAGASTNPPSTPRYPRLRRTWCRASRTCPSARTSRASQRGA